mmetsp:Transcript_1862/g.5219  ORF Transcript_1862/g.5219 Transcript_1862/m.5219 type:complete len:153 (+) Transcript_1862:277-735(+)
MPCREQHRRSSQDTAHLACVEEDDQPYHMRPSWTAAVNLATGDPPKLKDKSAVVKSKLLNAGASPRPPPRHGCQAQRPPPRENSTDSHNGRSLVLDLGFSLCSSPPKPFCLLSPLESSVAETGNPARIAVPSVCRDMFALIASSMVCRSGVM